MVQVTKKIFDGNITWYRLTGKDYCIEKWFAGEEYGVCADGTIIDCDERPLELLSDYEYKLVANVIMDYNKGADMYRGTIKEPIEATLEFDATIEIEYYNHKVSAENIEFKDLGLTIELTKKQRKSLGDAIYSWRNS